jgi:hypothetical protein
LEIRLRRGNALAMDAHKTGRLPGKSDLARWNIVERDFRRMYAAIKDIGGAAPAKEIIQHGKMKRQK